MSAMVEQLGRALGLSIKLLPGWGALTMRIDSSADQRGDFSYLIFDTEPLGVDMHKVAEIGRLVDTVAGGALDLGAARAELDRIASLAPASAARFVLFCGAGATALAVIFGVADPAALIAIGLTAMAGGTLRRAIARFTPNHLLGPLSAALLAGLCAALVARTGIAGQDVQWVGVCPCMILVPGPHLLNGSLDLARGHVVLGSARIAYAFVLILMICVGLLSGLAFGGVSLPVVGLTRQAPFVLDVIAAGVAVAAYGTFFSMPWRLLGIPVTIGMLAHSVRWLTMLAGGNLEIGTLAACVTVSILVSVVGDRLNMPFAALAFAASVSMIPGVYLFRMAEGLISATNLGAGEGNGLLIAALLNGALAAIILVIIALGLITPKMCLDYFKSRRSIVIPRATD